MEKIYNRIAGDALERLNALSDGVFAFAMTLLVLDIRVPQIPAVHSELQLWQALLTLAPRFLMYAMSFLTLGIFWIAQQTQLNHLARSNRNLAWIHIGFLALVALMPFSTMLLAEFIELRTAFLVYWLNISLLTATLYFTWRYSKSARLLKDATAAEAVAAIDRRIMYAQLLYALSAMLCLINTYCSIAFMFLLQLNYAIAPRFERAARAPRGGGQS